MQKIVTIHRIDENAGRVLVDAPGVADNTSVAIFLNNGPVSAWGTAKILSGRAVVVGKHPLPATYSLRLQVYPLRPKLLDADPPTTTAPAPAPVVTETPDA